MADAKWNFGSVHVEGQAVFGDAGRIEVHQTGVHPTVDEQRLDALLRQLSAAIATIPDRGPGSLPPAERSQMNSCLLQVSSELKKKQTEQDAGFLGRSFRVMGEVLKAAPGALKSALELKSLLGL
jgi:hypothetical protein